MNVVSSEMAPLNGHSVDAEFLPVRRVVRPIQRFDRLARWILRTRLASLSGGSLSITDVDGDRRFGDASDLSANLRVSDAKFYRGVVAGGALGFAESYIRGDWDSDDLPSLFRLFLRDSSAAERFNRGWARVTELGHRFYHWCRDNSLAGSRRNIRAHYDLGNGFFGLWLDDTWAYSCGIFASPDTSPREASLEKFDRVCRKLELGAKDHLLEIGSGWGGMAIHAAERYGCRVTTTTISREQLALAQSRVESRGLGRKIELLGKDYRQLDGLYDKLASIEMIEAVGYRRLDCFFRQLGRLLRPTGTLVLQAIVAPEKGYARYRRGVDFIRRYVFPGGCLPSLAAMLESAGRASDLRFVHAEDMSPHYAETLRHWRRAFLLRRDEARSMGFDERFLRLWEYYLCYCEAAFEERSVGVLQIQFDKPGCRRDPLAITRAAMDPSPGNGARSGDASHDRSVTETISGMSS